MPPRPPTLRPRAVSTANNPFLVDENGRVVLTLNPRRIRRVPVRQARVHQHPHRPRGQGWRAARNEPLTDNDLYLNDIRPPVLTTDRPHHTYPCGHGSCYVCARKWLEYQWMCPTCRTLITSPPFRNFDAEAAIVYDHPEWDDRSLVNFSWDGLKFPKMPIAPDTP
ncbi:hypothetical protein B0H11DRAFT_2264336 [Mycena galericulata]|nr:hypothetical protein B0H11DRAFT_2264336 [Mycena galericulata]